MKGNPTRSERREMKRWQEMNKSLKVPVTTINSEAKTIALQGYLILFIYPMIIASFFYIIPMIFNTILFESIDPSTISETTTLTYMIAKYIIFVSGLMTTLFSLAFIATYIIDPPQGKFKDTLKLVSIIIILFFIISALYNNH